jgi:hypothetical protein
LHIAGCSPYHESTGRRYWKDFETVDEATQFAENRAGVQILVGPYESDSIAYGEPPGKKVLTCLFEDPDGIILQFDQRLG